HLVHLALHSFPTRRSSDLSAQIGPIESTCPMLSSDISHGAGVVARRRSAASFGVITFPFGMVLKSGGIGGSPASIIWRSQRSSLDRKSTRLNSSHVSISYA